MAGTTVATWVKVKTKTGFTARPISHKYEGGASFEPGQVITQSEYQKLKAEGNQKRDDKKTGEKASILQSKGTPNTTNNQSLNDWLGNRWSAKFGQLKDDNGSVDIHVGLGKGNFTGMLMVSAKSEGKTIFSAPFNIDRRDSVESIRANIEDYFRGSNPKAKLSVGLPPKQKVSSEVKAQKEKKKAIQKAKPPGTILAGNGTFTGSQQNDEFLARYKGKTMLTASQENALRLYEKQATADISKVKIGQGVGYSLSPGKKGAQINRGFRVVDKDPETKMVKLRQVADTGITVTGGNDRLGDTWVHAAALVTDNKYNK